MADVTDRTLPVDEIFSTWDNGRGPGCAVGVLREGELVHARGYGLANIEHGAPITADTVFDLASTSKHFTALCVLLLAADGELSLDDDVRAHLPELSFEVPVTVRQLVHHTGGVRDYFSLLGMAGMTEHDVPDEEAAVRLIARQRTLSFPPGAEHSYSNSGYVLLAALVRRLTDQSIAAFAEERLFVPLGMAATSFCDDVRVVRPHRASGYAPGPDGTFRLDEVPIDVVGDGGIVTSVNDLARWDRNLDTGAVGGAAVVEELVRTTTLTDGTAIEYAAGLQHGTYRGLRTVGHGGAFHGFRAMLVRFPDERFSVIVLCNLSAMAPGVLARRVADVYLADRMAPAPSPRRAGEPETDVARWTGTYEDRTRRVFLVVEDREGTLVADIGLPITLESIGDGAFRSVGLPFEAIVTFTDARARVDVDAITEPMFDGERIERVAPTADELRACEGEFQSKELLATWCLVLIDDALHLRIERAGVVVDHALEPMRPDRYRAGSITVDAERDASGR